jgi:hypothetical protein
MITIQDIKDHQNYYPSFDADRLIAWLTEKGKWNGKGFRGYTSVARANNARKRDDSIARYASKETS